MCRKKLRLQSQSRAAIEGGSYSWCLAFRWLSASSSGLKKFKPEGPSGYRADPFNCSTLFASVDRQAPATDNVPGLLIYYDDDHYYCYYYG